MAGWNTLSATVEQLGDAYVSNQNIMNRKSNDDDENTSGSEEEVESAANKNHYDEQDDDNLLSRFHRYKHAAKAISEKHGFYVDGDLHEILSLSDVFFLKENEYSDEQISHFGAANLDELRNIMVNKYVDSNVKFDTNLYNQISEVLRDFRPQDDTRQVPDTDIRRPDGHIYKMKQRKINCSVSFVEVKPEKSDSTKRHEDIIRLTVFCKGALELV
ncbi:hypothetical protein G6F43_002708 [Rhizopus delemar]|nr:hypothetical protein G6F43_002708 [Rhizopus delemar]